MRKKTSIILLLLTIAALVVVLTHNVPSKVTMEDEHYISLFLQHTSIADAGLLEYEDQIAYIRALQQDIQEDITLGTEIVYGFPREPKNLFEKKKGLCYDIGRSLEKAYIMSGLKTRHVAVYVRQDGTFKRFRTLLKKDVASHSIQEVKTKKGWLVVDSNFPWIALDSSSTPYSMKQIARLNAQGETIAWETPYSRTYGSFYDDPTIIIYGLLSRHGQFYPPYNRIPDYNLRDLLYNF